MPVLRAETVIDNPEEFRVRKHVLRKTEWVAMRRGVAYLFRYRGVSLQELVKAGMREQPWQ